MGNISRRGLLGGAGTAALGAATLGTMAACDPAPVVRTTVSAPPLTVPQGSSDADWAGVRAQFALDPTAAQFAAFVFASPPAQVRAAIERHRALFDADPIGYLHANEVRQEAEIHRAAASYLDTGPDQICFTDSTTMGLGLLYNGLRLAPGDEVLTTEHDFYSTHEALRFRAARDGVTVRRVRLYADPATASADEIVGNLIAALTPATRVIALTWVHSSTGVRLPIRAIADKLAALRQQQRPLLCVDAVHGFGAVDAGPKELGCDFLVSGCHKWLFGPRGTGLIWGTAEGWTKVNPVIPPFDRGSIGAWLGFAGAKPAGSSATPGGYHAFEHQWALTEAFDFHQTLGRARIAGRIQQLADALKAGLAGISGVKLMTPRSPELSAGVVCCAIDSTTPDKAVQALREQKVYASATPYEPSYLRFGTSIVTTAADVERAVAAVRKLT